jgi:hypothetical protein
MGFTNPLLFLDYVREHPDRLDLIWLLLTIKCHQWRVANWLRR